MTKSKRTSKLYHGALAVEIYNEHLEIKENIKNKYFEKKLSIIEKIEKSKKRVAEAKESIVAANERIAAAKKSDKTKKLQLP